MPFFSPGASPCSLAPESERAQMSPEQPRLRLQSRFMFHSSLEVLPNLQVSEHAVTRRGFSNQKLQPVPSSKRRVSPSEAAVRKYPRVSQPPSQQLRQVADRLAGGGC